MSAWERGDEFVLIGFIIGFVLEEVGVARVDDGDHVFVGIGVFSFALID